MKTQTPFLPILIAAAMAGSAHAALYLGNGSTGFGGPIGTGSLQVTDDGTNLSFTLTRGTAALNDTFVIYFDSAAGGATALPNSGEIGSPFVGRRAVVNEFGSDLTFGSGFSSDFAFALKVNGSASNHLFTTPSGVNANTATFITTAAVSNFGNATAATYSWTIPLSSLDLTLGETFDFHTTYLNPNGGDGSDASFRSNEAMVNSMGASSPGFGAVTLSSPLSYTVTPEPGVAILGSLGFLMLLRRRK
ncbi:hypothetical protein [Luteolibacter sp. Populi]|uniref:hypothetical protein n=1 Tax=Luteolibacter sp. Populi TaxID=3230487 RepID=UPI0034668954